MKLYAAIFRHFAASAFGLVLAGCAAVPASDPAAPSSQPTPAPASSQTAFSTSDDAIKALQSVTQAKDTAALRKIFGPEVDQLLSGDAEQDAVELDNFAKIVAQMCNPVNVADDKIVLYLGEKNWPFPIPLVRAGGQWFYDTPAGREEVRNRRIGQDELTAISVCQAYVGAQHDYASEDRDGNEVLNYAQRLNSNPGKHDGLYWEPVEDEDLSPLGPLVTNANAEGYGADKPIGRTAPFHGYLFKILKQQGPAAAGGAYNYVINGNMVAGFALVAYPAHWGESGIMTFIVNQNGVIFQRNLGEKSAEVAPAMDAFNPDREWAKVTGDSVPQL